jgi:hypothetical protein
MEMLYRKIAKSIAEENQPMEPPKVPSKENHDLVEHFKRFVRYFFGEGRTSLFSFPEIISHRVRGVTWSS